MESIVKSMQPAVKNDFFFSLLRGDAVSEDEIIQKLKFIDGGFSPDNYGCIVFQVSDYEQYRRDFDENSRTLHSYTISQVAEQLMQPFHDPFAFIKVNRSEWALIVNISSSSDGFQQEEFVKIIHLFQEQFSLAATPFLRMGYGRLYRNLSDLPYSYREALESLKFQQYSERSLAETSETLESIDYAMRVPDAKLKDSLMESVRTGSADEASEYCSAIFSDVEDGLTVEYARAVSSDVVNSVLGIFIELGIDIASSGSSEYYEKLKCADSLEALRSGTAEFVRSAAVSVQSFNNDHSPKITERLLEYINTHLGEDISLNDLAAFSHLSAPYVSRLFKENLNIGFVEYMNTQRIAKARQLLKETTLTVEQIGFQVGFNNVRSFMRTFKKYENTTPGQYRSQFKEE
ncbi:helix-turn-helix domain-containing protein [Clostridium sp. AM58-1XD]|uniref:helix-turn-helix domain-containing protein n=1 Tax=Clostridium sp. AM58-1XD TaxID=2292307 RepID=UPI000E52676A|nr:helix-turn-helix domain-containing protein [Clostridium sp. AM58-1XD]RGY98225.1 AraC family transcriptional regulator [Clostridium sp. AM58-1XD]